MIRSLQFKEFFNSLSVNIGMNLLKTNKRPSIRFKIDISEKLKIYLKKKYGINGRFRKSAELVRETEIITNNYYNETECHQILHDSFEIILTNEKVMSLMTKKNGTIEERALVKKNICHCKISASK